MQLQLLRPAWTLYLVPARAPISPAVLAEARRRQDPPRRRLIERLRRRDNLLVDVRPRSDLPPRYRPCDHPWCEVNEMAEHLSSGTEVAWVAARSVKGSPTAHAVAARALAVRLGELLETAPVDADAARVLEAHDEPDDDTCVSEWVSFSASHRPRGCWCTTEGLARFGLPELQTVDMPPAVLDGWQYVLAAVGQHVFNRLRAAFETDADARFVDLDVPARVTATDVAMAHGCSADRHRPFAVHLRFEPRQFEGGQDFLTIDAPAGAAGARYLRDLRAAVGTAEEAG
jgi:hypothetical protein